MSLHANIDQLAASGGAVALAIGHPGHEQTLRVDLTWPSLFEGSLTLLGLTDHTTIRLAIGEQTLIIQKALDVVLAVVVPTVEVAAREAAREEHVLPRPPPAQLRSKRSVPPPPPRKGPRPIVGAMEPALP